MGRKLCGHSLPTLSALVRSSKPRLGKALPPPWGGGIGVPDMAVRMSAARIHPGLHPCHVAIPNLVQGSQVVVR